MDDPLIDPLVFGYKPEKLVLDWPGKGSGVHVVEGVGGGINSPIAYNF